MDDDGNGRSGGHVSCFENVVVWNMSPGPNISPSSCKFVRRGVCGVA